MADEKQEAQKTIVAFVVGLLIGGLLVWAFSGPSNAVEVEEMEEENVTEVTSDESMEVANEEAPAGLAVGDGNIVVSDQTAGDSVSITSAVYPVAEGWIGVRDYQDGQLGMILGVVRFSQSQGLVPTEIVLQRATKAGSTYAVVVYTENGDLDFNLANDVQIDQIFSTFTAQ